MSHHYAAYVFIAFGLAAQRAAEVMQTVGIALSQSGMEEDDE